MKTTALLSCLVAIATVQAQFPEPTISNNGGLEFRLKDGGYRLVSFHYSINKPLPGVAAGEHAADVRTPTGNEWVLTDSSIQLQPGDTVNYWVLAIKNNGEGLQITDKSWTYVQTTKAATTATTAPVATPAPTAAPALTTVLSGGSGSHTGSGSHSGTHTGSGSNTGTHTGSGSNIGSSSSSSGSFGSSNFGSNSGSFGSSRFGGTTNFGGGGGCSCPYGPGIGDGFVDDRTCQSYPCLIFDDEFDFMNHKVWEHELTASGGGNWEFQYYVNNRTNSYTKNGVLYLKPTLTADHFGAEFLEKESLDLWGGSAADVCTSNMDWGCRREGRPGQIVNPIQSARLRSSRGFNFRFGKVEVEAKLPKAIWMLPRQNVYGKWPASGEIDIMESRGNLHYTDPSGTSLGADNIGSTLHFGPNFWTNQWPKAHKDVLLTSGGSYADDFHKYGVEWDNTSITFTVDGTETLKVAPGPGGFWEFGGLDQLQGFDNPWSQGSRMAPFDVEFYLVLNVAVGGVGFFDDANHNSPNPKPWVDKAGHEADRFWAARNQWYPTWNPDQNDGEDAALKINYIKVWKTQPDSPRH